MVIIIFKEFTRGQVSKLFNIKAETLRYYDNIGLLKPDVNNQNGYSIYRLEHLFILSSILRARYLEISISDIKKLNNEWDLDSYENFIDRELEEIKRRQVYLEEAEKLMRKNKAIIVEMKSFKNNFDFNILKRVRVEKKIYKFKINDVMNAIIKNKGFLDITEREKIFIDVKFEKDTIFYDTEDVFIETDFINKDIIEYLLSSNISCEKKDFNGYVIKQKFVGSVLEIKKYIREILKFYKLKDSIAMINKLTYIAVSEKYFVEILIKLN